MLRMTLRRHFTKMSMLPTYPREPWRELCCNASLVEFQHSACIRSFQYLLIVAHTLAIVLTLEITVCSLDNHAFSSIDELPRHSYDAVDSRRVYTNVSNGDKSTRFSHILTFDSSP